MTVSFSIVIPTLGRPTLERTLSSAVEQMAAGDEAVVVSDGPQPAAQQIVRRGRRNRAVWSAVAQEPGSRFGNYQRDVGMRIAAGTHLLFLDDDDAYLPGALTQIRAAAEASPTAALIFRAEWGAGHPAVGTVLWRDQEVREQNVATPMVCLPARRYERSWMDGNAQGVVSDFAFLQAACREVGAIAWHEDIVAIVRPLPA